MYIADPYLMRSPLRVARNFLLQRVTPPATEPVTLAEAKLYLRIDSSDDDTLINDLIVAARMTAESWLRRSLITQTWKLAYDYGIPASVWLPMGPVTSVTSVVITDQDNSTHTLDSATYKLNASMNALVLNASLMGFNIAITYNTGYGNAAAVPKPIKQGMLAHIAAMYDLRGEESGAHLPEQAVGLYMPFKEMRL